MAWFGGIIPLDAARRDRSRSEELPAHRAYAESYDFVGYLSRRGRWEDTADDGDRWPFRRFLTAIGARRRRGRRRDGRRSAGRCASCSTSGGAISAQRYLLMPIGLLGLAMWIAVRDPAAAGVAAAAAAEPGRLARWEQEERERVVAPPYVAWPGDDPFAETDPDEDRPRDPQLLN